VQGVEIPSRLYLREMGILLLSSSAKRTNTFQGKLVIFSSSKTRIIPNSNGKKEILPFFYSQRERDFFSSPPGIILFFTLGR
jgi:hypothetical protein